MFIPLLFLRLQGNPENFYDHVKNHQDIPLVTLLYVSWCPHCQQLHPNFEAISKEYEKNQELATMEINCSQEEEFCKSLGINTFPTFIVGLYNQTKQVSFYRSTTGLQKDFVRLLKIKNRKYNEEVGKPLETKYPYYEITVCDDDEETKKNVDVAIATLQHMDIRRFHVKYSADPKPEISAVLDDDFKVYFTQAPTSYNITDFIKQNSIAIFGQWSLSSISNLDKRIAIFVPKSKSDFDKYRHIAHKYYDRFVWVDDSGTHRYNLVDSYFHLKKPDLPAIVIMDSKATYYTALKNIDDQSKLKDYEGQIERDVFVKNYFKINVKHEQMKNGLSVIGKLFLKVFFGVLSVILIILFVYIKIDENKQKKLD